MTYLVCFDQYELQVEIICCLVFPPNRSTWPSDLDYHGYQEMEFEVVSGIAYDEEGENPEELDKNGCAAVADLHAETIEEKLWAQLEDEGGDHYD